MINVKNKRRLCCCGKEKPTFNEPGNIKPICCYSCKTDTMIWIKKCVCGKSIPRFYEPGETKPICCSLCKTNSMVWTDNYEKRILCKCGASIPSYNEPGETKRICCIKCKTNIMVNLKSKKCKCSKAHPSFNIPGETKPICCSKCKTETMVNIVRKMCPGLIKYPDDSCPLLRQGNKKYKNYCTRCFSQNFPLDPLTFQIRSKTKEDAVRDFINANFDGFQHDRPLTTGHCDCTIRRRIDHRKLIGNTMLAVETDENQHKSYDKMDEQTRYDDLYMAHSGKWIYIRFNPDKYITTDRKRKNPMIATRLEKLKDEIIKQIKRIGTEENTELIERIYMYYDGVH